MLIGTNDLNAADCNMNETELLATVPGISYRYKTLPKSAHGEQVKRYHRAAHSSCGSVMGQPLALRSSLRPGLHVTLMPQHVILL